MTAQALILMVKNPIPGKVKTRLATDIGTDAALAIYRMLLEHAQRITCNLPVDIFVFYSDVIERNDLFDNKRYKKYTQCSGDLGIRMDYAFSIPFKNEYKEVIMIGSDCLALTQEHIESAFIHLHHHDFVIGPAKDGGYYLIGMKKWNRWVLENKSWSTEKLLAETRVDIISRNGTLWEGPQLSDIDTITDLKDFPSLLAMIRTTSD